MLFMSCHLKIHTHVIMSYFFLLFSFFHIFLCRGDFDGSMMMNMRKAHLNLNQAASIWKTWIVEWFCLRERSMKFYKRKIQVILKLGRLTKVIIHHHSFFVEIHRLCYCCYNTALYRRRKLSFKNLTLKNYLL